MKTLMFFTIIGQNPLSDIQKITFNVFNAKYIKALIVEVEKNIDIKMDCTYVALL